MQSAMTELCSVSAIELTKEIRQPPCPLNLLAALPTIAVPSGFTRKGAPLGLQLVSKPRTGQFLLQAAAGFEAASPWAHVRPDV